MLQTLGRCHDSVDPVPALIAAAQPAPIIYVVDDDVSVREALQALFSSMGWRSQMFVSATAFLSYRRDVCPACLILDLQLPDINGLDLQMHIAADQVLMPVIFVTAYGDIPKAVRAMKAGAHEFLTKPFDGECLLDAVQKAIERSRVAHGREAAARYLETRYACLTEREREVMALITNGLLNKQVGARLGISEITVKAHRGKMMKKMGAPSLPHLVKMAAALRLDSAASRAGQAAIY